ncbi:protein-serine O-palmitoleoyltransferase porcupine [Trichonephila clavata]|uniref:Protein-serine O-palmitoleoyltransferase porcupine n=1 Tax=Trichonephila clavata TaxID=2740835 RepID=A0A8X6GBP7_TRICU|nr:protein-serine O-palmitoleoyltransferase porcupine [Trichonephila clavata]
MDYDYDLNFPPDYYDDFYEDYGDLFPNPTDYTLQDLWTDCLIPTLYDGFWSSAKLLCCSLLLKFTLSLTFLPDHVFHVTSSSLGLYCVYNFFGNEILYIIIFAVVGYCILLLANNLLKQYQGVVCTFFCFFFLIICELFFADKKMWHRLRGCQMLLSMKLISLGFDTGYTDKQMPSILPCFGYLFHVGTVIFGPWISYSSYMASKQGIKFSFSWVYTIIRCTLLSYGFLTVSTCWTSFLLHSTGWKWIDAYRDALSFRSSHYFVSYISEVTATLSGVQVSSVSSAFEIEIPRSLVEVVVWWNVPMHFWLKTYVFKTAKPLGDFIAILLTYAASSLLHGLNFQLAAVLLSLGFYTYIEHALRKKLASVFNACILARKCKPDCGHLFQSNHVYVRMANIGFGLLSIFHLAYLGVMFDSTSGIEEEGYNMNHTLQKWAELDFSSHWIALFCYIFYYLV